MGDDTLYNLYFADDQVMIVDDEQYLRYMAGKLLEEYEKPNVIIRSDKCNNSILDKGMIKDVDKCKY